MYIDFHNTILYQLARAAGFSHEEARTIGYASQFVDDQTDDKTYKFDDGSQVKMCTTGHTNWQDITSDTKIEHSIWCPFHFVPANVGSTVGERLRTAPKGAIGLEMIFNVISKNDLHALGVLCHTVADFWSHAGFNGVFDKGNAVFVCPETLWDATKMSALHIAFFYLGHAFVLDYIDRPYRKSTMYREYTGEKIERDNAYFIEACDTLFEIFTVYRTGTGLKEATTERMQTYSELRAKLVRFMALFNSPDYEVRLGRWYDVIKATYPEFKNTDEYDETLWVGKGLVKNAHGDYFRECYDNSDLKKFNDAAEYQKALVLDELMPKYGLHIDHLPRLDNGGYAVDEETARNVEKSLLNKY